MYSRSLPNSELWEVYECFSQFQSILGKRMISSTNLIPLFQELPHKKTAKYQNRVICIPIPDGLQLCILNYFQIKPF